MGTTVRTRQCSTGKESLKKEGPDMDREQDGQKTRPNKSVSENRITEKMAAHSRCPQCAGVGTEVKQF